MPDSDELSVQSHLELERRVRERAHQIWLVHKDTRSEDAALDDWLQAEREVLGARGGADAQNRATVVGDARRPDPDRMEGLGEA